MLVAGGIAGRKDNPYLLPLFNAYFEFKAKMNGA
jgi:hypothetical protein